MKIKHILLTTLISFSSSMHALPDWFLIGTTVLTTAGGGYLGYCSTKEDSTLAEKIIIPLFFGSFCGFIVGAPLISMTMIAKAYKAKKLEQAVLKNTFFNSIYLQDHNTQPFSNIAELLELLETEFYSYPLAEGFNKIDLWMETLNIVVEVYMEVIQNNTKYQDWYKNRVKFLRKTLLQLKEAQTFIYSQDDFDRQNKFSLKKQSIEEQRNSNAALNRQANAQTQMAMSQSMQAATR